MKSTESERKEAKSVIVTPEFVEIRPCISLEHSILVTKPETKIRTTDDNISVRIHVTDNMEREYNAKLLHPYKNICSFEEELYSTLRRKSMLADLDVKLAGTYIRWSDVKTLLVTSYYCIPKTDTRRIVIISPIYGDMSFTIRKNRKNLRTTDISKVKEIKNSVLSKRRFV